MIGYGLTGVQTLELGVGRRMIGDDEVDETFLQTRPQGFSVRIFADWRTALEKREESRKKQGSRTHRDSNSQPARQ